jgi:hypothetical protein
MLHSSVSYISVLLVKPHLTFNRRYFKLRLRKFPKLMFVSRTDMHKQNNIFFFLISLRWKIWNNSDSCTSHFHRIFPWHKPQGLSFTFYAMELSFVLVTYCLWYPNEFEKKQECDRMSQNEISEPQRTVRAVSVKKLCRLWQDPWNHLTAPVTPELAHSL